MQHLTVLNSTEFYTLQFKEVNVMLYTFYSFVSTSLVGWFISESGGPGTVWGTQETPRTHLLEK